jgi:integrase
VLQASGLLRRPRTFALAPETIAQLRRHKASQAELKMANRLTDCDFGLLFAMEPREVQTWNAVWGQPLQTIAGRRYQQLVKASGVRRMKFHGLSHTSATLDLHTGTPPADVASRLGHSIPMLLSTYTHAMPDQGRAAAERRGSVLHGRG